MMSVTVSAPGKLFLLGEHAVVYGGQCIVTAVNARLRVTLTQHSETDQAPRLMIDAPDVDLEEWAVPLQRVVDRGGFSGPSAFIESCVSVFYRYHPFVSGLHVETNSDFGATLGLGSSSAIVAAMLYGLGELFDMQLTRDELFEMGIEAIQQVQKTGSGADLAAAVYGGTVYYANQQPRQITPLEVESLPLVAVYSGEKAGTVNYVRQVRTLHEQLPDIINPVIDTMLAVVEAGRTAVESRDWEQLGRLMNIQHGLLHALGVDTVALATLVLIARSVGAWGAKLSGAGGGDCAIVLVSDEQRAQVVEALRDMGGEVLEIEMNAPGVRIEV